MEEVVAEAAADEGSGDDDDGAGDVDRLAFLAWGGCCPDVAGADEGGNDLFRGFQPFSFLKQV